MTTNIENNVFADRIQLKELRVAHRDLDATISKLNKSTHVDQISMKRLKRQKLKLKDLIVRMESELIPNLNA